jgi:ATP-dependent RNA helicase SUPV3L1/SUV3
MLLGVALAAILDTDRDASPEMPRGKSAIGAFLPVGCLVVLGYFGIKEVPVFREMAPLTYRFGGPVPELSEALLRIDAAARAWPGPRLHTMSGKLHQQAAAIASGADRPMLLESAERSFREAAADHPFDPEPVVNLANVLSAMEQDAEAAPDTAQEQPASPEQSADTAEAAVAAEPELIEVWRPGRRFDERRGGASRPPRRAGRGRQQRRQEGGAPAEAASATTPTPNAVPADGAAVADASAPAAAEEQRKPRRRGRRPDRGNRGDGPEREARGDRPPQRDRDQGRERHQRGDGEGRGDRPPRREREQRRSFQSRPPAERREKVADPNSPFAKLAALKEQLEAASKERP